MSQRTVSQKPILSDVLSVILPTSEQTLLLRACLHSGEAARQAWQAWQAQTGDARELRGMRHHLTAEGNPVKGLLPLLYGSLRRNKVVLEPGIVPILKNAYLREQVRYESYRNILSRALSTLESGGVSVIVLKGAALAETAYALEGVHEPALRHSHDIELLVHPRDLSSAVGLLVASGLRPLPSPGGASSSKRAAHYAVLCHASGLPVSLYTRLFQIPYYCAQLQEIWGLSSSHNFGGVEARVLSPAAHLLQVCGHASYSPSRRSLVWVCDAWFLIRGQPEPDWDLFSDLALRSNLSLPLSVMLSYLAQVLNAPIPMPVLDRLDTAAAQTGRLGREVALRGARRTPAGNLKNLIGKANGWSERMIVVKWLIFPSAHYLRMMQDVRHPSLMPLYYLLRPLRYLAGRVEAYGKHLLRPTTDSGTVENRSADSYSLDN